MTAGGMSETEWQKKVVGGAHGLGWKINHHRKSIDGKRGWKTTTTVRGFPDLFLWHPTRGGFYIAELKTDDPSSKPSEDQKEVLAGLLSAGIPCGIWRPRHWTSHILPYLAGRAGPPFVALA
jgi:hypothetical protein